MSEQNSKRLSKRSFFTRGKIIAGLAVVAGLAVGAQAIAESRPGQHLQLLVSEGGVGDVMPANFMSGHRFGRGSRNPFADMSDEEIDKLIARGVAHGAIEAEASDEQRDEVTAIVTELARKIRPVPQGFREAGEQMRALLLADTVDALAIETVRAERIAEADRVSREITAAMTKISNVLTPKQRKTVAERIETFRAVRERRRRH